MGNSGMKSQKIFVEGGSDQIIQKLQMELEEKEAQLWEANADKDAKHRELQLIYELDNIRDAVVEPIPLFNATIDFLAQVFSTDVCALYLFDRESKILELSSLKTSFTLTLNNSISDYQDMFSYFEGHALNSKLDNDTSEVSIFALNEGLPSHLNPFPKSPQLEALTAVAMAINVLGRPIGLLIVGRVNNVFDDEDLRLLKAAETQIDSAIVQAQNRMDQQLANKELDVIYLMDNLRDMHLSLKDMTQRIVLEMKQIIQADMSFVMLYKTESKKLTLTSVSDESLREKHFLQGIEKLVDEALGKGEMVWYNNMGHRPFYSGIVIPLILQDVVLGVLGAVNTATEKPFLVAQRRLLRAIASQMDTAIFESLENFRLKQVLGRSLDPKVMQKLLASPDLNLLNPERHIVTVLFVDMRNSTDLAEKTEPVLFCNYMNVFLSKSSECIISHQGLLDKFIGDEVMALFNVPVAQPDHCTRAIRCAIELLEIHQSTIKEWTEQGVDSTPIGIGIASGECVVGEFGCALHSDYTAIGHVSNLAARLCSQAKGNEILVCKNTFKGCQKNKSENEIFEGDSGEIALKGFNHCVPYYKIKT